MYISGFFIIWTVTVCGIGGALLYREGYRQGVHDGRAQGWRQSRRLARLSSTSPRGVN